MFQSVKDRDYFMAYNLTYHGKYADPLGRNVLKKYDGIVGDISYQWSGRVANFFWHTNGFMGTAYIDIEPKTEAEIDAEAETYYDYSDYSD